MDDQEPSKDETNQRPVPRIWRATIEQIVLRFVADDFELAGGVPGVEPLSVDKAAQIRAYVHGYGASLVPLEPETWDTSVSLWMGDHWEVLVDLRTLEEGRSDLVLHLEITEDGPRFCFAVYLVYVP